MKRLIVGAGAQGRVVYDNLNSSGMLAAGFLDDNLPIGFAVINDVKVVGTIDDLVAGGDYGYIIAIGHPGHRAQVVERLDKRIYPYEYCCAIHRAAVVMPSAKLGLDNSILANAYIGPDAIIGNHTLINIGAIVEHDSVVEDFATVSSGAIVGGRCHIGKSAFIAMGATIGPHVRIGEGAIVGAGAVVLKDVPAYTLVYGTPAKIIREVDEVTIGRLL